MEINILYCAEHNAVIMRAVFPLMTAAQFISSNDLRQYVYCPVQVDGFLIRPGSCRFRSNVGSFAGGVQTP